MDENNNQPIMDNSEQSTDEQKKDVPVEQGTQEVSEGERVTEESSEDHSQ